MCGRAAQTSVTVSAFVSSMKKQVESSKHDPSEPALVIESNASAVQKYSDSNLETHDGDQTGMKNYNMSPGMDAMVFWKDATSNKIHMDRKVWGLVSRGGTQSCPIPEGMGKHFEGLMFNARSDTLFQKPTFSKLVAAGQTCLIALDGYFEWKSEVKGRKQPYFVYRKAFKDKERNSGTLESPSYLLIAGLWTRVPTGRELDPFLDTFCMITTEVCDPLNWLHTRMPVVVWDETLALEWLLKPSEGILHRLDEGARGTPEDYLDWHAVTPEMSSMKYRSENAIKPLPKMKTVKSFFLAPAKASMNNKASDTADSMQNEEIRPGNALSDKTLIYPTRNVQPNFTAGGGTPQKRSSPSISSPIVNSKKQSEQVKKPKVGTLHSFFKPKS